MNRKKAIAGWRRISAELRKLAADLDALGPHLEGPEHEPLREGIAACAAGARRQASNIDRQVGG